MFHSAPCGWHLLSLAIPFSFPSVFLDQKHDFTGLCLFRPIRRRPPKKKKNKKNKMTFKEYYEREHDGHDLMPYESICTRDLSRSDFTFRSSCTFRRDIRRFFPFFPFVFFFFPVPHISSEGVHGSGTMARPELTEMEGYVTRQTRFTADERESPRNTAADERRRMHDGYVLHGLRP